MSTTPNSQLVIAGKTGVIVLLRSYVKYSSPAEKNSPFDLDKRVKLCKWYYYLFQLAIVNIPNMLKNKSGHPGTIRGTTIINFDFDVLPFMD